MPAIKLTGGKSPARTTPARKSPARKPAAKAAPKATTRSTRKSAVVAAPAPVESAPRSPKLPEGWTKADLNRAVKDMQRAKAAREKAAETLKEAQKVANTLALELLQEGVQMSVISTELELSRQWMYTLMEEAGIKPARSRKSTSRGRTAPASKTTSKPAAKRRPAAKASAKPAAKRTPARKPAATAARGRIRIK